jgi:hypothetical protein
VHELNDSEFETYLRSYRSVVPIALPRPKRNGYRTFRALLVLGTIAAGIAILVAGIAVSYTRAGHRGVDHRTLEAASPGDRPSLPPLTVGSANGWLGTAPSMDAALDDLAFRSKNTPSPANNKSAIAVLRQENTTL